MSSSRSKPDGSTKAVQISITVGALLVALIHLIWPRLAIDGITITLIGLAVLPWLAPLLRSLELPGGLKVTFKDFQEAERRAREAGLLAAFSGGEEYSFQLVADEDPNLALAGLRIELEKRLHDLAKSSGISARKTSVAVLLDRLREKDVLSQHERTVLDYLIDRLNKAVHGADVDKQTADWAMKTGPRILKALEDKI